MTVALGNRHFYLGAQQTSVARKQASSALIIIARGLVAALEFQAPSLRFTGTHSWRIATRPRAISSTRQRRNGVAARQRTILAGHLRDVSLPVLLKKQAIALPFALGKELAFEPFLTATCSHLDFCLGYLSRLGADAAILNAKASLRKRTLGFLSW